MQSAVAKTITVTQENILVCSPTGTGKTELAILCILKVLLEGRPRRGKTIYIAPMKALVSEIVSKLQRRLCKYGLCIIECTGDSAVRRDDLLRADIIVATPEKWDIVTRSENAELDGMVRAVIFDEVHLLRTERGATIETLVSRTLRQVETTQTMVRLIGLSATLPNYADVAEFLCVGPQGLFYFGEEFRATPLETSLCIAEEAMFDGVCFEKVRGFVADGHQVLVFVHSRNATHRTARFLMDELEKEGFVSTLKGTAKTSKIESSELRELARRGAGIHHAGLSRGDRAASERLFDGGLIKILVSTATLAWGVNLPAHAVVVKGTKVYNSERGVFEDISILDVLQMFGRAGRPDFDTFGEAVLISTQKSIAGYFNALTLQTPIESRFLAFLSEALNTEIVAGTVCTVADAVSWLKKTYLCVRLKKNPLCYGVRPAELEKDAGLENVLTEMLRPAFNTLLALGMAADEGRHSLWIGCQPAYAEAIVEQCLVPTERGRVCSLFYLSTKTADIFFDMISGGECSPMRLLVRASEFDQIVFREQEIEELLDCGGCGEDVGSREWKVSLLVRSHIEGRVFRSGALSSDTAFVVQNVRRILSAILELAVVFNQEEGIAFEQRKSSLELAMQTRTLLASFERRCSIEDHPLRQLGLKLDTSETLKQLGLVTPAEMFAEREACMAIDKDAVKNLEAFPRGELFAYERGCFIDALVSFEGSRDNAWTLLCIDEEQQRIIAKKRLVPRRERDAFSFYKGTCTAASYKLVLSCDGWLATEQSFVVVSQRERRLLVQTHVMSELTNRTAYVQRMVCKHIRENRTSLVIFKSKESLFSFGGRILATAGALQSQKTDAVRHSPGGEMHEKIRLFNMFGIDVVLHTDSVYDGDRNIVLCEDPATRLLRGRAVDLVVFIEDSSEGVTDYAIETVLGCAGLSKDGGRILFFVYGMHETVYRAWLQMTL
eukprot:GHVN01002591.1.p1 GENE.GHVN01002591.1~~GHVN01002591.1.p1  ORF type:complete len:1114 (+),score=91.98 GHVN01002591.1:492-3344(+)